MWQHYYLKILKKATTGPLELRTRNLLLTEDETIEILLSLNHNASVLTRCSTLNKRVTVLSMHMENPYLIQLHLKWSESDFDNIFVFGKEELGESGVITPLNAPVQLTE